VRIDDYTLRLVRRAIEWHDRHVPGGAAAMRLSCVVTAAAFLGGLGGGARPGLAATPECTAAALQAKAPAGTTITAAAPVAAAGDLPAYCQVDGTVTTPGNSVNFRLGLPANWNGKLFFQGVGGFAGSIGSLNAGLQRGYASASTDTGHQGATAVDAASCARARMGRTA
jgi:tannase/feruloyl esterase